MSDTDGVAALAKYVPSDFQHYTLGKKLGSGTFGVVHVALLDDGRFVAVKQLDMDTAAATAAASAGGADSSGNLEIEIHKRLSHHHIIRYLHSTVEVSKDGGPSKLHVFLEYVTGGSVTAIMKSLTGAKLPYQVVRVYTRHMLLGLDYLHSNGIAHRDIKGDNLLVSQDTGIAKLADFDQAKVVAGTYRGQRANTLAGTPYWIAPEVITDDGGYNPFKADVWSMACTVAEMFTGRAPWHPMATPMAIMYKLANTTGWPDAIPTTVADLGEDLHSFLSLCFERDASVRPSVADLLDHPFVRVGSWKPSAKPAASA